MFRIWLRIIFMRADRKNFLRFQEAFFRKVDEEWSQALWAFKDLADVWLKEGRPFDCQIVVPRSDHPIAGWSLGRFWPEGPYLALTVEGELYHSYRRPRVSRWLLITRRGGEHLPCMNHARRVNCRYLKRHLVALEELRHVYFRVQQDR